MSKLDELQLLLHGLNLGYLTDIMAVSTSSLVLWLLFGVCYDSDVLVYSQENDITWSHLLSMEKEDLEQVKDDP